jgi:uncharacterized membrane protein
MFSKLKSIHLSYSHLVFGFVMALLIGIFAYISITNHNLYRTYALDLGMFNHALYQINHFSWPLFSLSVDGNTVPYFADHFSPIIYLFAPFYSLFGTSTLLWIQLLSVVVFGIYVRKICLHHHLSPIVASILPVIPLCCWAVFAAIGFDFHTNVIAAMLVAPLIYYTLQQKLIPLSIFFILIILSKENMSLWMFFILTGLCFYYRDSLNKRSKKYLLLLSGFSVIYFVMATSWWMPALHPSGTNIQLNKYIGSGGGISGVLSYCISHPLDALELLYKTPEGSLAEDKLKFILLFLTSGGLLWFIHPILIWFSLPIAAQKFLSLNGGPWGIEAQYSIEIVPLIAWGSILFLKDFSKTLSFIFIGVSILVSVHFSYQYYIIKQPRVNFLDPTFSTTRFKIDELNDLMKKIPEKSAVSCISIFGPRLANREKIYHFPNINDADYIALLKGNLSTYPLNNETYQLEVQRLKKDSAWTVWQYTSDALVLRRK